MQERQKFEVPLSAREFEITQYLIDHNKITNKQVGKDLGISEHTVRAYKRQIVKKRNLETNGSFLTHRELQILNCVALFSPTNKQIGEILGISEHTVRAHARSINAKTRKAGFVIGRTSGLTTAVVLAINEGWINVDNVRLTKQEMKPDQKYSFL